MDTIRVDNLSIQRMDGSMSPIWTDGSQTQVRPVRNTDAFENVRVRTVQPRRAEMP